MRKIFLSALILLLAIPVSSLRAAENKLESWYTYWGIGWGGHSYSDDARERLQDQQGLDHAEIGLDLLGFYWPIGENTVIGGIMNVTGDVYSAEALKTTIVTSLLSFSTMKFLTNKIGEGWFLRGDIGLAQSSTKVEVGSLSDTETSDTGFGFLLGGGYGLPVSAGTRLLFNFNYSIRRIENESFRVLQISLGGLF